MPNPFIQGHETTIKSDKEKPYILVYNFIDRHAVEVIRLPISQRNKCSHIWKPVVMGHGRWSRGCNKCGALSR